MGGRTRRDFNSTLTDGEQHQRVREERNGSCTARQPSTRNIGDDGHSWSGATSPEVSKVKDNNSPVPADSAGGRGQSLREVKREEERRTGTTSQSDDRCVHSEGRWDKHRRKDDSDDEDPDDKSSDKCGRRDEPDRSRQSRRGRRYDKGSGDSDSDGWQRRPSGDDNNHRGGSRKEEGRGRLRDVDSLSRIVRSNHRDDDRGDSDDSDQDDRKRNHSRRGKHHGDDPSDDDGSPYRSRGRGRRCNQSKRTDSGDNDPDDSPRRRRSTIKPEKFCGDASFEAYMFRFESAAKHNRWDSTDKLAWLQASLTGQAAQLLCGLRDPTYKGLVKRLRERYGAEGLERRYIADLHTRRKSKDESLRELAQDIKRLVSLAYPGEETTKISESIAIESFLRGLSDSEMATKIRERDPRTFEKAVKLALLFETTSEETSSYAGRRGYTRRVTEKDRQVDNRELSSQTVATERCSRDDAPPSNGLRTNDGTSRPRDEYRRSRQAPRSKEVQSRSATASVAKEDSQLTQMKKEMQDLKRRQELEKLQKEYVQQCSKLSCKNIPEYIKKLIEEVDDATPESVVLKLQELLCQYIVMYLVNRKATLD